jgi:D-aminoacyl-tRNA deacylase
MIAVIQRVSEASVHVDGEVVGSIGQGLLVLLGIAADDTRADADYLLRKLPAMRIFSDGEGKMNRSVIDVGGAILLVSQFTLLADTRKGNRPSFTRAAAPAEAIPLYEYLIEQLGKTLGKPVATGRFGADMQVSLVNNGPITIVLNSADGRF